MREIICNDIKTVIRTKRFWITAAFIIFLAIINVLAQLTSQRIENVGALGLFIYGNIYIFPAICLAAPFIPVLVFSPLFVEDIKTGAYRKTAGKTGLKKYLAARSISSLLAGGGVFIVAHLIMLIVCFAIDPSVKVSNVEVFGLFKEVFYTSVPLYILLFIVYSALYGSLFSFLSMGVGLITKSYALALVLPGIWDLSATYLWNYFNIPFLSWICKAFPSILYNFDYPVDIWWRVPQMGGLLLLSVTLVVIGYFRLKKHEIADIAAEAES